MYYQQKPQFGTLPQLSKRLAKGLVGCWLFNEAGGSKVYDLSGKNNHGTLINFALPPTATSGWHPGRTGQALKFDGVDDYVNCGSDLSLNLTANLTISAWIRPTSNPSFTAIVSWRKAGGDANHRYEFGTTSGKLQLATDVINAVYSNTILSTNIWHHITVTLTSTTVQYYLKGVPDGSGTVNAIQSETGQACNIGKSNYGPTFIPFFGSIDDVRIYNSVLSADEIKELYLTPYAMFEEDPIWWMAQQAAAGPNFSLSINNALKDVASAQIMVDGAWKPVPSAKVMVGGTWKSV